MRISIVSDGTVSGTKIVDAETGERVGGVTALELVVDAKENIVDCVIHVWPKLIQITTEAGVSDV